MRGKKNNAFIFEIIYPKDNSLIMYHKMKTKKNTGEIDIQDE